MPFIYGLNIANDLGDVEDKTLALNNLGLNPKDLNVIKNVGLTEIINLDELHLVSGLTDNQDKILSNLVSASAEVSSIIEDIPSATAGPGITPVAQEFNLNLDDRLVAGAIKYNFTNFDTNGVQKTIDPSSVASIANTVFTANTVFQDASGVEVEISVGDKLTIGGSQSTLNDGNYTVIAQTDTQPKTFTLSADATNGGTITSFGSGTFTLYQYWNYVSADISTSRVSSWSPVGVAPQNPDDHILYGGQLKNNGEFLSVSSLSLTTAPLVKKYRSEQPTHIIELYINGAYKKVPAVKGLPITLSGMPAPGVGNALDFRVGVNKDVQQADGSQGFLFDSIGTIPVTFERQFPNDPANTVEVLDSSPTAVDDSDSLENGNKAARYNQTDLSDVSNFKIFYIPEKINYLRLTGEGEIGDEFGLNIDTYSLPTLLNLTSLNFNGNALPILPDFNVKAPVLKRLRMKGNNLSSENTNSFNPETSQFEVSYDDILSRLPTTLDFLDLRESLKGDNVVNIDFTRLQNLEKLLFGQPAGTSDSQRIGPAPGYGSINANGGTAPIVRGPSQIVKFAPATQPSTFTSAGVFTITDHGLQAGDYVQYWERVDSTNTLAGGINELTSSSAIPGANNTIYEVATTSGGGALFTLKTYPGGTAITSYSGTMVGTHHELVRVNADGTPYKRNGNDGQEKSVEVYKVGNSSYTIIPNEVLDSTRLEGLDMRTNPFKTSNYPYRDNSTASKKEESDWQASVKFDTNSLKNTVYYHDTFSNIPNFSGNTQLSGLSLDSNKIDSAITTEALRNVDHNLFQNLTALTSFKFHDFGISHSNVLCGTGDLSSAFNDKPNLETLELINLSGIAFTFANNTFNAGNNDLNDNKLKYITIRNRDGDTLSPVAAYSDFWGVDGTSGRTGQALSTVQNSLLKLDIDVSPWGGGRLVNSDDVNNVITFPLGNLAALEELSISGGNVGAIPSLAGMTNLEKILMTGSSISVPFQSMKKGGIYQVQKDAFGANVGSVQMNVVSDPNQIKLLTFEYEDMGWYPGNDTTEGDISGNSSHATSLATHRGLDTTAQEYATSNAAVVDKIIPNGTYNWEFGGIPSNSADLDNNATQHGTHVKEGDLFMFRDLTANQVVQHFVYIIKDLGTTTTQDWTDLGWVANSAEFGTGSTPKVGDKFRGSDESNTQEVHDLEQGCFYRVMKSYPAMLGFLVNTPWNRQGLSDNPWQWYEGVTFEATQNGLIRAGGTPFFVNDYGMYARKILPSEHDSSNVDANFPASEKPKDFGTGLVARRNSTQFNATDGTDLTSLGFFGNVPTLTGLTSLEEIDLSFNTLTGNIPNIIAGTSISKILLNNNQLVGTIPSMTGISDCEEYDFSFNNLSSYTSGNFSSAISFHSLDLKNNRFPELQSKNSSDWNAIKAFFEDVLTAVNNRQFVPDSAKYYVDLQNQIMVAVTNPADGSISNTPTGLNYTQIIQLDTSYSTDPNSIYSTIQAIENRGWEVKMDGKV